MFSVRLIPINAIYRQYNYMYVYLRYGDYKLIWGFPGVGDLSHPYPWPKPAELCPVCSTVSFVPVSVYNECTPVNSTDGFGISYFQVFQKVNPAVEGHRLDKSTMLFNIKSI